MSNISNRLRKIIYLIVADKTDEFNTALYYATRLAQKDGAGLAVLSVMEPGGFTHWGNVEALMAEEEREKSENSLWHCGQTIYDLSGIYPCFLIESGDPVDVILHVLDTYPCISKIILAGDTHGKTPGHLVTHFTGKGLEKLRLPLLLVPGHMSPQSIDRLLSDEIRLPEGE